MTGDGSVDDRARRDFSEWVEPHLQVMNRMAARLVSRDELDDVVQDALVRAWVRRETYDPRKGSAAGWLIAIVRDQARRRRTRSVPATARLDDVHPAATAGPVDLDLENAVAGLAPRQRLVIDLHYFVGLDVTTCAEVMGCAEGTVKATLHQARLRLRAALGEEVVDHE